jgi:hypothetical protein
MWPQPAFVSVGRFQLPGFVDWQRDHVPDVLR